MNLIANETGFNLRFSVVRSFTKSDVYTKSTLSSLIYQLPQFLFMLFEIRNAVVQPRRSGEHITRANLVFRFNLRLCSAIFPFSFSLFRLPVPALSASSRFAPPFLVSLLHRLICMPRAFTP